MRQIKPSVARYKLSLRYTDESSIGQHRVRADSYLSEEFVRYVWASGKTNAAIERESNKNASAIANIRSPKRNPTRFRRRCELWGPPAPIERSAPKRVSLPLTKPNVTPQTRELWRLLKLGFEWQSLEYLWKESTT